MRKPNLECRNVLSFVKYKDFKVFVSIFFPLSSIAADREIAGLIKRVRGNRLNDVRGQTGTIDYKLFG